LISSYSIAKSNSTFIANRYVFKDTSMISLMNQNQLYVVESCKISVCFFFSKNISKGINNPTNLSRSSKFVSNRSKPILNVSLQILSFCKMQKNIYLKCSGIFCWCLLHCLLQIKSVDRYRLNVPVILSSCFFFFFFFKVKKVSLKSPLPSPCTSHQNTHRAFLRLF
jgi:hypothetical protein